MKLLNKAIALLSRIGIRHRLDVTWVMMQIISDPPIDIAAICGSAPTIRELKEELSTKMELMSSKEGLSRTPVNVVKNMIFEVNEQEA